MKRGYIKLYRKSKDSTVFAHEGLWKLFCLCLMKANHEGAEVMMPGLLKPIKLEPGQFITGRKSLWEDYHQLHLKKRKPRRKPAPSLITVYRWLLTLQEMELLNIKSFNKYSIITITKWNRYQENEQQMNNRRTTDEHKQELNKELNKKLYEFFVFEIGPARKSKQRTLKNIEKHLKRFSYDDLKSSILNYKSTINGTDPTYRKDPANFFGINEPYFLDFLPENFQSITSRNEQQPSMEDLFSND